MSQPSHVNRTAEAVDSANLFKKPTKSISIGEASFTRYWALAMLVFVLCILVAMPAFATTSRVTDGQQVLYTFNEGSGSTVRDVSGVGTPLDLTIQNPKATNWLSGGGLAINSSTLITSAGAASKVIKAIKASNAITLEAWLKPANTQQTGPARIVSLSQDIYNRNLTLVSAKPPMTGAYAPPRPTTTGQARR